jgi:hypothetical protein
MLYVLQLFCRSEKGGVIGEGNLSQHASAGEQSGAGRRSSGNEAEGEPVRLHLLDSMTWGARFSWAVTGPLVLTDTITSKSHAYYPRDKRDWRERRDWWDKRDKGGSETSGTGETRGERGGSGF